MAIINNYTFTLQQVSQELYGDANAGRNLFDCLNYGAVSYKFDQNYIGSKNCLQNFRNYGAAATASFETTVPGMSFGTPEYTMSLGGTSITFSYTPTGMTTTPQDVIVNILLPNNNSVGTSFINFTRNGIRVTNKVVSLSETISSGRAYRIQITPL